MQLAHAIALFLIACASGPPPVAQSASTAPARSEPANPREPPATLRPPDIPPAPESCTRFGEKPEACSAKGDPVASLKAALDTQDALARDQALAELGNCKPFPSGLITALRAELVPTECGDASVAPALNGKSGKLRPDVESALSGLGLAAKLYRLVREPPRLSPPFDKKRFGEFMRNTLMPWIVNQARAVQMLSERGARLAGYGKAVAAVEAGLADMRFVEVIREVPLPEEMNSDPEVRDVYFATLDEALEPRKARGRDAALVGLAEFAREGVLKDGRVDRARSLLSKLYSGRRIDALDRLLLPPLPPLNPTSVHAQLATRLPAFYAGLLLTDADPSRPELLRALLERGLPRWARVVLESPKLDQQTANLYVRALFELGQRFWRSEDFQRAGALAVPLRSDEAKLFDGLATALQGGPRDAAQMMLSGPRLPAGVGDVKKLDALARGKSPLAPLAEFDAAYLLQLAPPAGPDPKYWLDVADRFHRAAKGLQDPASKRLAGELAKAAQDTAKALEGAKNGK